MNVGRDPALVIRRFLGMIKLKRKDLLIVFFPKRNPFPEGLLDGLDGLGSERDCFAGGSGACGRSEDVFEDVGGIALVEGWSAVTYIDSFDPVLDAAEVEQALVMTMGYEI